MSTTRPTDAPRRGSATKVLFEHPRLRVDQVPHKVDGTHVRVRVVNGIGGIIVPICRHRGITRVGLIAQYRPVVGRVSLELPRGATADLGELAAIRLADAEVGAHPADGLRALGVIHPDTGVLTTELAVWSAVLSHEQVSASAGHRHLESGGLVQWYPVDAVMEMIGNGRIHCALTMGALQLAQVRGLFTQEL